MVGGATHQQQQASQLVPPSPATSSTAPVKTSPEEDELLKRNTDCVYFLASPLTCKKGSECEYRHSEVARVNPRDCYYWLNANCLNPKCAFRHPPLDGLLGSDASTPMGPPAPAPHVTPYAMPKQGVACIFFQKGFCLKGHLCPFVHGPVNSVNNIKPPQSGPEKPVQDQKLAQQATIQKVEPVPSRKVVLPPNRAVEEPPRYKPARVLLPPVMNEPLLTKPNRGVNHGYLVSENDRIQNGKDADEYSREHSPGFDVLVDTEVEDSEYYQEEGEITRSRGQDYDVDHVDHVDHVDRVDRVDRDMYREHREYDHYNERRPNPRSDSPDHFIRSDLRDRLSNQRRGSESDRGFRAVVSQENYADRIPRRDSRHNHHQHQHRPDQGTLGSRLRGRIKIPGRSTSPVKENGSRAEREIDIERKHLSRYSPGRPLPLNQTRVRDRLKGNDSMFAGPKRLSELKTGRPDPLKDEQFLGKRKYPKVEDSSSFEGPKPLSEILKRKRGVNNNNNNNNNNNSDNYNDNNDENNQKEKEEVLEHEEKSVSVDFEGEMEKDKPETDGKSVNNVENEGGLIDEDALLDEELEAFDDDQRDGEYDYEQIDGEEEDYNLDEAEYIDEEDIDGDEFEKKENVVYS